MTLNQHKTGVIISFGMNSLLCPSHPTVVIQSVVIQTVVFLHCKSHAQRRDGETWICM